MKVVASFIYPPIPIRRFDWMAHIDGDEEGPTGYGETEADALRDLAETLAETSAEGANTASTEPVGMLTGGPLPGCTRKRIECGYPDCGGHARCRFAPALPAEPVLTDQQIDDWITTIATYTVAGPVLYGREAIHRFARAIASEPAPAADEETPPRERFEQWWDSLSMSARTLPDRKSAAWNGWVAARSAPGALSLKDRPPEGNQE